MTKPKPAETKDLSLLLTFPDSVTGEAVIAELVQRLRDSESAFAGHKRRYGDAALEGVEMLSKHLVEAEAFEHASAHISAVLERARKRLVEVKKAESEQAGAEARSAALALAGEAESLLRDLLDQANVIAAKIERWSASREELERLNGVAIAGGAERVSMPQLRDDEERAAELAAESMKDLGEFFTDRSHEVWSRQQRALRAAETEAAKKAAAPTAEEARALRAEGFDPDIIAIETATAEDGYRRTLVLQKLRGIRRQAEENERTKRIAEAEEEKLRNMAPVTRPKTLAPTI